MDDETRRGSEAFRHWVDETKPGRMVFFGLEWVSTESGIPENSGFLKTFRRLYGITPAEYRSQNRKKV